jgi:TolA-binding protein
MRTKRLIANAALALIVTLALAGCGGSSVDAPSAAQTANPMAPPTASIDSAAAKAVENPADDPESLIAEVTRLRTLPDRVAEVSYQNGEKQLANERPLTEEEIQAERRTRLEKIVELTTLAITKIHHDPEREQLFNNAVHYLADARLQLALLGDTQQAQLLTEDAEALFQRDRTSFAAVEAAYKVVQLAESTAEKWGRDNPEWTRAYANQARLFVEKFPQEQARGAVSLIAAGRKCEQKGQLDEARKCFFLVEEKYPETPFAEQIAGILRRLRLPGQPLELAGPTIDGGFFNVDKCAGRAVLAVFWASNSETFLRDLPALKSICEHYSEDKLAVIGVNLDQQEGAVDQFLAMTGLHWTQIFFSDPNQRGGKNPVARYYGVQTVPTYWLADKTGTVVEAPADIRSLPARLEALVSP